MKKLLAFASLFFVANATLGSVIYYPSPYLNPYLRGAYSYPYHPFYHQVMLYPTTINECPLQPSYYDPYGNWVPPQRVCPSTEPHVHVHF